ncbi:MAG: hypothetical protein IT457_00085 [Planctomycetes bacterium]|nr:hypothetical protein [Planctomycetota bacterium]
MLARIPALTVGASFAVLAATAARAQSWSPVPSGLAPPARANHAGAYDVQRSRFVIFGGIVGGSLLSDTWEFDGLRWHARSPLHSPPPLLAHAMAYDAVRGRCVLFGGARATPDSSAVAETWEWDGTDWTQLRPATAPSARLGHAMAFDWVRSRVVLFGGRNAGSVHESDTWSFDGNTWTRIATSGPSARCCFDLAFDFASGRILLFGGWNQVVLGDTWDFDGTNWVQRATPLAPSARWGHRMADDLRRGVVVLHGGNGAAIETWEWGGASWSLRSTSSQAASLNAVFEFDWAVGRPTLFGGSPAGQGESDATWTYGNAIQAAVTAYGSPCPGPLGTPRLALAGPSLPWLGQSFLLQSSGSSGATLLGFGWSNTSFGAVNLPLALAPYGAPGCSLLASQELAYGIGAPSTFGVAVPYLPGVAGLTFYAQSIVLDPAANALGITSSNGLALTIGWR